MKIKFFTFFLYNIESVLKFFDHMVYAHKFLISSQRRKLKWCGLWIANLKKYQAFVMHFLTALCTRLLSVFVLHFWILFEPFPSIFFFLQINDVFLHVSIIEITISVAATVRIEWRCAKKLLDYYCQKNVFMYVFKFDVKFLNLSSFILYLLGNVSNKNMNVCT